MKETTIDGNTGDLMTVEEFKASCEVGAFIDYDGFGDLVIENKIITPEDDDEIPLWVKPSRLHLIPADVTHILWYNK